MNRLAVATFGVLAFGAVGYYVLVAKPAAAREKRRDEAAMRVKWLHDASFMYALDNKRLPATLKDLLTPGPKTNEPYIDEIRADPWGRAHRYTTVDAEKRDFEIRSAGPDGAFDTSDDLVAR